MKLSLKEVISKSSKFTYKKNSGSINDYIKKVEKECEDTLFREKGINAKVTLCYCFVSESLVLEDIEYM